MHLISDFCNRLNQASASKLSKTIVKNCIATASSSNILYKLGYIRYYVIKSFKYIVVHLKYTFEGAAIRGLFSLSKPSLKFYITCKSISKFCFNNFFGLIGFMAISTNKGKIMLDFDCLLNGTGGQPI